MLCCKAKVSHRCPCPPLPRPPVFLGSVSPRTLPGRRAHARSGPVKCGSPDGSVSRGGCRRAAGLLLPAADAEPRRTVSDEEGFAPSHSISQNVPERGWKSAFSLFYNRDCCCLVSLCQPPVLTRSQNDPFNAKRCDIWVSLCAT